MYLKPFNYATTCVAHTRIQGQTYEASAQILRVSQRAGRSREAKARW